MNIEFRVDGTVIALGALDDNATARDFAALLPLSLRLVNYDATEKIADLPRALAAAGGLHALMTPVTGDMCFYAPWGNLAIFYRDGVESKGLVLLGHLLSGVHTLQRPGPLDVTITLAARRRHNAEHARAR